MSDCLNPFAALLQPAQLAAAFQQNNADIAALSNTNSSPPYSQAGTEQMQYSTPESCTDQRTDTPSSDQLNGEFSTTNDFSPDNGIGSDRDPSPDCVSTSSAGDSLLTSAKPISAEDAELQQQILRLQSFNDDAEKKPTLNLLSSFHSNPLLAEKLANCILPGMPTPPSATVPMTPSLSQTANTHEVTPTKRKRQRRNPVWPYFDVIDGTARCKQCLYSTKSVFSTNLKVHLRSHHRADYEKVIQAEDALNLNALLLSGNSSKLFSTDLTRKRMPPMTSSILMTINKLASQSAADDNPLNSVLRQTLAAGTLNQQLQQVQNQLQAQAQQKQQQQQQQAQQHQQQQQQQAQQQQHQQHHQQAPLALNAANLAALNQMARNQLNNAAQPLLGMTPEQFTSHFNFLNPIKRAKKKEMDQSSTLFHSMLKDYFVAEMPSAPHGTDANGMPQPKRRRLRRHPVWMFFKDLEDRMVGCINCSFRTGSAFSTNLKMHLKAHHKDDYERVLKLEGDMRVEENVTGPPNKIKNELIDFIRGGGNASTATNAHPSAPRASPLIQQFISQTMAARQGGDLSMKKESMDEDPFNGMSMSDKLAALVGLVPAPGGVEGEIKQDDEPEEPVPSVQSAFDEIRRAADNMLAANMGLAPPPQEQTIVNLNGSIVTSETQSTSSASTDDCDDKKVDRDMALAKFWFSEGANNNLLQSEQFKALSEVDSGSTSAAETFLSGLALLNQLLTPSVEGDVDSAGTSSGVSAPETPPIFDVSTLTYDGLFDGLTALQKHFGVDELTSFTITIQLLKSSARTAEEQLIVETVTGGLERIYNLNFETNRSERTKKLISEKMKLKRLFETNEQREQRLHRMKERYRQQRSGQEAEKPDRRRKEHRTPSVAEEKCERSSRSKEERLVRLRDYQRRRLLNEKPEQRARRLAKMRENQKLRRARQMAQRSATSDATMDFVRSLAPDYEIPEAGDLAGLVDGDIGSVQQQH